MYKLSVIVPTHDMQNKLDFLQRNLDSLWEQNFQDFEIVVTDNSDDDKIQKMCEWYGGINYYRNPIKGMAPNTNEGIRRATGQIIKILYLDDYLAHPNALTKVVEYFDGGWLVTACEHSDGFKRMRRHYPEYNDQIYLGNNTIGSPSVLAFENEDPLFFDEKMTWLLDCDYYRRLHQRYGAPTILRDVGVVIGVGLHQMTYQIPDEIKRGELEYMRTK